MNSFHLKKNLWDLQDNLGTLELSCYDFKMKLKNFIILENLKGNYISIKVFYFT